MRCGNATATFFLRAQTGLWAGAGSSTVQLRRADELRKSFLLNLGCRIGNESKYEQENTVSCNLVEIRIIVKYLQVCGLNRRQLEVYPVACALYQVLTLSLCIALYFNARMGHVQVLAT